MYRSVLIAGGAGFVGSTLAIAIRRAHPGTTVIAFDNLHRRGSEMNLLRLKAEGVDFVYGDVRSLANLAAVRPAPDLILECSAEPSVMAGYGGSPEYLIHTNLNGCFHCLEIARLAKADFLFVSSSRVYPVAAINSLAFEETDTRFRLLPAQTATGAGEHGISEEFPLSGARSLYGMTKLAAELMVEEYGDAYGIRYAIDRCGLLTGPWQMAKADQGVVAYWVAAHCLNRGLKYIGFGGAGKQVRDFLHIDDFCDLVLDQMTHFDAYAGRHWNVGGGVANSVSLREATALCREITGRTVDVASTDENRPADLRWYITDHRAVSAVRGWHPQRDARRTIGDIAEWIEGHRAELEEVVFGR
jgi:CDP-paratose 2-epimerase